MQPKKYHVIVSGTEFYLYVKQIGGTNMVPMIDKQENYAIWQQANKNRMMKKMRRK